MKGSPAMLGGPSVNKPAWPLTLSGAATPAFFVIKEGRTLTKTATQQKTSPASLPKCTTGIQRLDEITSGGENVKRILATVSAKAL
jgi:hypothetical protein